jgi:tetratricopeptide (TPR) repeat protein
MNPYPISIKMVRAILLFLLLLSFSPLAQAQVERDVAIQQLIQQTLDEIYNLDFKEAELHIQQIRAKYPHHPVASLLPALALYWKEIPLTAGNASFQPCQEYLQQCLKDVQPLLEDEQTKTEAVFFALTAHGYRAMIESDAGNRMAALGESKKAFSFMKQGFKLKEKYPEFYLTTGLYNFYVEQYPEDHPMLKPFMWFFPDGDKELGLQQLEIASQKGILTKTEALYYLVYINQRYRSNPARALEYSQKLVSSYPKNLLFVTRHVESLVSCGKYQEAQPFVTQLLQSTEKIYLSAAHTFQGMIEEKQHRNLAGAKEDYQKALRLSTSGSQDATTQAYTNEFYALAYAGLGRIAAQEGDKASARGYYKKSLNLTERSATINEAKAYLKG